MNVSAVQPITFGKKDSSSNISKDVIIEGGVGGGSAAILANGKKLARVLPKKAAQKASTVLDGAEVVMKKSNAVSRIFKGAVESLGRYKLLKPFASAAKSKFIGKAGAAIGGFAAVGALAVNLASTVNVGEKLFDSRA